MTTISARSTATVFLAEHDADGIGIEDVLPLDMSVVNGQHRHVDGVVHCSLNDAGDVSVMHSHGTGHITDVHAIDNAPHDIDRARGARHDARAQRVETERLERRMVQLCDEHGRHAVNRRAPLGRNRPQRGFRIDSPGRTIAHPCVTAAILPRTHPKQ